MKIKKLPKEVVSKISAGEVIERPASVVKELVENSLDAKATMIKLEVEDAGLKKISIVDDGEGIAREDIEVAIKPHTTSKIRKEEDLVKISSLGFRGEALASIAAVSRMSIKSKINKASKGALIEVEDGEVQHRTSLGLPKGTVVKVENLFSSVPARKKFLRKKTTEVHNINDIVTRLAIAYPDVGFYLTHNGKSVVELQKGQKIEERTRLLLGDDIFDELIPIDESNEIFEIKGYLGKPQISGKSRNRQFLYINNRSVVNEIVNSAIKEAYGSLLAPKDNPAYIIFLTISPDLVDVNTHPRKEEVKFVNSKDIYSLLVRSAKKALKKNDLLYRKGKRTNGKSASGYTAKLLKERVQPWNVKDFLLDDEVQVMQLHDLYLIMESEDGLLMIDQHAAHERILYEQFLEGFRKTWKHNRKHKLEDPIVFDLPVSEVGVLNENIQHFNDLGFVIEEFGDKTFKVTCIPSLFVDRDIMQLIQEVLEDLLQEKQPKTIDEKSLQTISYLACRTAIKAGDKLTPEERRELIKKLMETKTNYTCPHGRPVQMEITKDELERLFKRK